MSVPKGNPVAGPVTIRLLGAADMAAFRAIRLESLRLEPSNFGSTAADWAALTETEWQRRLTTNPVIAAFRDAAPVGLIGLIREKSSRMEHRATVVMVYLRASERRHGVGQKLLETLTDHARKSGVRQLELQVNGENPGAVAFYRRMGFRQTGLIPAAVRDEDGRETDDLLMVRRIDG